MQTKRKDPTEKDNSKGHSQLILISLGMRLMPFPGAGDDFLQVFMFGLPAKLTFYFFRRGNETGRIARAARQFICRNGMPCDLTRRLDHFADRIAIATP